MQANIRVSVTHATGAEAWIEGDPQAVRQIEIGLQRSGARWNPSVETWDFGFYSDTPRKRVDFNADA